MVRTRYPSVHLVQSPCPPCLKLKSNTEDTETFTEDTKSLAYAGSDFSSAAPGDPTRQFDQARANSVG